MLPITLKTPLRVFLATALILGVLAVPLQGLFPGVGLSRLLALSLGGALAMMLAVLVPALLSMQFRQWLLRHGATDTAWFWFPAEPPGLEAQRAQLRAAAPAPASTATPATPAAPRDAA
jgi:hypothetical protein